MARGFARIGRGTHVLSDEQLLGSLFAELAGPADADVEEAWLAKVERRDRELQSGAVQSIPAEDVFREVRAILAGGIHGG